MSRPYGVMADLHCHPWSAFSSTNAEGVNSRLAEILHEIDRCCASVQELGGDTVVIAGDIFHVRGSVAPSVFNPVRDKLRAWVGKGIQFLGIPGNHDLEGRSVTKLGSSVSMLDGNGIGFCHAREGTWLQNMNVAFQPWIAKHSDLLIALNDLADHIKAKGGDLGKIDLFIHAGIDGVLPGMPEHGLKPSALAALGFKRVFAGDYHNHMAFPGGVYSIGAPTHHTWGDVGAKAGFLLVTEDKVKWVSTHAPQFIDITGEEDEAELPLIVDGHYVRARIGAATAGEITEWRDKLTAMGARGVLIQSVPVSASAPRGTVKASIDSVESSVAAFATAKGYSERVSKVCGEIIAECVA